MNIPKYNKANRKEDYGLTTLPKGQYVCKIMGVEEVTSAAGNPGIKIFFDIAEGEYKDFYAKKYQADTREDKTWARDATYWLNIPYDGCHPFITDNYDTFWANVEDSNNGYVFDGNEKTIKGKIFGAVFRLKQSKGKNKKGEAVVYDNVELVKTFIAQDIRDGKVKYSPKDVLIQPEATGNEDFMQISEGAPNDLPF